MEEVDDFETMKKKRMSQIQVIAHKQKTGKIVVAFDLYGTLLSTDSISRALADHFGDKKAEEVAATWRKYQLEYTWRSNSMKRYQSFLDITYSSLQHALNEHGLALDEAEIDDIMDEYDNLLAFPDVPPSLERLRNVNDVSFVVFSNGTKEMISNSIHRSEDLRPYGDVFKKLVSVEFVRCFKPAPVTYKFLAHSVNKVGDESTLWLVSSNPFDIVGAKACGLQTIWLDRDGIGWQDKLSGEPSAIIRSLKEIADVVEEVLKSDL